MKDQILRDLRAKHEPIFEQLNTLDGADNDDGHGRVIIPPQVLGLLPGKDGDFYLVARHTIDQRGKDGSCPGTVVCQITRDMVEIVYKAIELAKDDEEVKKLRESGDPCLGEDGEPRLTSYEAYIKGVVDLHKATSGGNA